MKNIYIRADGGSSIGMGHIMRTLTLANEFKMCGYCVIYLCEDKSEYKSGINKIKDSGFQVVLLQNNQIECIISKDLQRDCLIIDSYNVNEEYFNKAKQYFKSVGYFDDMNLYYFNLDFIINQNLNTELLEYRTNKTTKMFLGCRYTMLRSEFFRAKRKDINIKVENILITLGGADSNNFTENIVEYIKTMPYKFHVVIGPSFIYGKDLEKFESKNIILHKNANMTKLMEIADVCISACGSTLYELAYMGIPTIGIIVADNQEKLAYNMEQQNLIINAGWYNQLSKEKLLEQINNIINDYEKRKMMNLQGKSLIDGKGAGRIIKQLNL